jgi:hypothetical protein
MPSDVKKGGERPRHRRSARPPLATRFGCCLLGSGTSRREVLPPSQQHPTAGGGWVLMIEPPLRKSPPGRHAQQAKVEFPMQSLRGGSEVMEVLEAYSTLHILERFGSYRELLATTTWLEVLTRYCIVLI